MVLMKDVDFQAEGWKHGNQIKVCWLRTTATLLSIAMTSILLLPAATSGFVSLVGDNDVDCTERLGEN